MGKQVRSEDFSLYSLSTKVLTTNPQNYLDKALAIGAKYRQLALDLAADLEKFSSQPLLILTDKPQDFNQSSQLLVFKHSQQSVGCYHDKRYVIAKVLWKSLLFRNLKFEELAGAHRQAIHKVQSKKKQAIETYRSQYLPIDAESSAVLPPGFLWRFFLPYEIFFKSELSTYLRKDNAIHPKD